ncbi:hypothetical protein GGQ85_002615 [Nitrobacter vulgaris]|nr:hypothetical protein [Nitrobacter vulgaris]
MRQSLFRLFDILSDLYRQSLSPITSLNRSLAAAHQSHISFTLRLGARLRSRSPNLKS